VRILLDTCTFLWLITDDKALSASAREIFVDPGNDVYLSAVSVWEMAVKWSLGRLVFPQPAERFIPIQRERHGISSLALEEDPTLYLHKLPLLHRDPFDRMLVCQALHHEMTVLTPDSLITQYAVRTAW
jgi:PIN domain nuclease of toxin-antitoxin system